MFLAFFLFVCSYIAVRSVIYTWTWFAFPARTGACSMPRLGTVRTPAMTGGSHGSVDLLQQWASRICPS